MTTRAALCAALAVLACSLACRGAVVGTPLHPRHERTCQQRLARRSWAGAKQHVRVPCDAEDVHCFVMQALRAWWGRRIPQASVERAWKGTTDGEHCVLVQVVGGRVLVHAPPVHVVAHEADPAFEPWKRELYGQRVDAYVGVINAALLLGPLPDLELSVCVGDCVAQFDPTLPLHLGDVGMDASFSVVQCLGSSTIPLPLFDVLRPPDDVPLSGWAAQVGAIKRNRDAHPWRARADKAVFRGGVRSCHQCATAEGYHLDHRMIPDFPLPAHLANRTDRPKCGRERAANIALAAPGGLDFAVHDLPVGHAGRTVDMPGHEAFKYVAYLHGHCHWANRLRRLLFMGMAVLKQVGLCEEFYGMRLQPWVHYIPVDYNLRNLTAAVEWARTHDDDVRTIVANMQAYADRFNTAEFAVRYTHHLLNAYGGMLDYAVRLRPGGRVV